MRHFPGYRERLQLGQTLVLFLAFLAALTGMLLVAFNSGQVSNAKMRAMNAADAAAYSGALFEARSLNFQAYMNRAIVVNEVSIAQSVSMRSWVSYLTRLIDNISTVASIFPPLRVATTAISRAVRTLDRETQRGLVVIEHLLRSVNFAESTAQNAIHHGTVPAATELASVVAKKNGAKLTAANAGLFVDNVSNWNKLTSTYSRNSGSSKTDGRERLKQVVLDSRDGFTNKRDWKFSSPLGKLRKQGGTDLIDFDTWKGLDSAEVRIGFFGPAVPVGWGGAQLHNSPHAENRVGKHGDINQWGSRDGRLANRESQSTPNASRSRIAFPNYRDIQIPHKQDETIGVPFSVEVAIDGTTVSTASAIREAHSRLIDGTTIKYDPHYVQDDAGVYALAEACVTFERPYKADRIDRRKEYPSLFNPYWRASMAVESRTARVVVALAKGLVPIEAAVGRGTCQSGS